MNNIKPAFASSIDPTKLSLTIESGSKVIIGIIGSLIALKGVDATPITNQVQVIVDSVVTGIAVGFTAWHSMQTVYGLVRKLFVTN